MRKLLYVILILSALSLQSCLKDDKTLFDKSASARMTATLDSYKTLLTSSQYGWALEYYPEESQKYGGYMYSLNFSDDKAKITLANIGSAVVDSCLYRLIGDNGPVLTFDTYSALMHNFANPSGSKTDGLRGDYEFILMSHQDNTITLKGKKTGNIMTMTKLTEPYNTFIDKVNLAGLKFNGVPKIGFTVGGESIAVTKASGNFTFTYTTGSKDTVVKVAYMPTTTGIKLYKPVTIKGETFQLFNFNSDDLGMTCTTNSKVAITFIYPPFNEVMAATSVLWSFNIGGANMSSGLSALLATAIATNTAQYGETLATFSFGLNPLYPANDAVNKYAFVFKSDGYAISYGYSITPVSGTTDQVKIALTKEGFNWSYYPWLMPTIKYIADHSPYKMETDNSRNPSYVKCVCVADPTIWFRVDK